MIHNGCRNEPRMKYVEKLETNRYKEFIAVEIRIIRKKLSKTIGEVSWVQVIGR